MVLQRLLILSAISLMITLPSKEVYSKNETTIKRFTIVSRKSRSLLREIIFLQFICVREKLRTRIINVLVKRATPRSFLRQLNDHGIYEQTVAFVAPWLTVLRPKRGSRIRIVWYAAKKWGTSLEGWRGWFMRRINDIGKIFFSFLRWMWCFKKLESEMCLKDEKKIFYEDVFLNSVSFTRYCLREFFKERMEDSVWWIEILFERFLFNINFFLNKFVKRRINW